MRAFLIGTLITGLAIPGFGFDDWRRDGYYGRDDRYGRNGGQYGRYRDSDTRRYGNFSPIERTISDLRRVGYGGYMSNGDRKHADKAVRELEQFRQKWQDGKWDNGKLDKAISEMRHLTDARQLNNQDRRLIARSIDDLLAFRSSGGRYSNRF